MKSLTQYIKESCERIDESTINRLSKWISETECGFITAFRYEQRDIHDHGPWGDFKTDSEIMADNAEFTWFRKKPDANGWIWPIGHKFTHEENRKRNKRLKAEILAFGAGLIKVKGVYPEGMTRESSEESYFVFNYNNKPGFKDFLLRMGEYFNQDSVYYNPEGSETGCLIGTNGADFPGYHQEGEPSRFMIGTASNYMSRLGNKAFSFVSDDAVKSSDKESAMKSIKNQEETQGYAEQHFWRDEKRTSFRERKSSRLAESLLTTYESLNPLTKMSMAQFLNKSRKS